MPIYQILLKRVDSADGTGFNKNDILNIFLKSDSHPWTETERRCVVEVDATLAQCDTICEPEYKADTKLTKKIFNKEFYDAKPEFPNHYFTKPTFIRNLIINGKAYVEVEGNLRQVKHVRKYTCKVNPDPNKIKTVLFTDFVTKL